MVITQVPIPQWNGYVGNWNVGRAYYNGPRSGQVAPLTTIVMHWFGEARPDQGSVDSQFRNASGKRSAHFSIQDTSVHQYVGLANTSYNSGVGTVNCESIGIEHAAGPGYVATADTCETSAQLLAFIARQLERTVSSFKVIRHRDAMATECSGTLPVETIVARALELERGAVLADAPAPVHIPVKEAAHCTVTKLNIRKEPSAKADTNGSFASGQGFWYVATTQANGHLWLVLENGVGYVASEFTDYNPNLNA